MNLGDDAKANRTQRERKQELLRLGANDGTLGREFYEPVTPRVENVGRTFSRFLRLMRQLGSCYRTQVQDQDHVGEIFIKQSHQFPICRIASVDYSFAAFGGQARRAVEFGIAIAAIERFVGLGTGSHLHARQVELAKALQVVPRKCGQRIDERTVDLGA